MTFSIATGTTTPIEKRKQVAIIVAHPDDETLWAGGTILHNLDWDCIIICLCRNDDGDRAPKFQKAILELGCKGVMGDMDDGPDQVPLSIAQVELYILSLLPRLHYDLIVSHSPIGEYTRHLRHEEVGHAVLNLFRNDAIKTNELWSFAYEDGGKNYMPRAISNADLYFSLEAQIWEKKCYIINMIYGFKIGSWEFQCTPKNEAFWVQSNKNSCVDQQIINEDITII